MRGIPIPRTEPELSPFPNRVASTLKSGRSPRRRRRCPPRRPVPAPPRPRPVPAVPAAPQPATGPMTQEDAARPLKWPAHGTIRTCGSRPARTTRPRPASVVRRPRGAARISAVATPPSSPLRFPFPPSAFSCRPVLSVRSPKSLSSCSSHDDRRGPRTARRSPPLPPQFCLRQRLRGPIVSLSLLCKTRVLLVLRPLVSGNALQPLGAPSRQFKTIAHHAKTRRKSRRLRMTVASYGLPYDGRLFGHLFRSVLHVIITVEWLGQLTVVSRASVLRVYGSTSRQ